MKRTWRDLVCARCGGTVAAAGCPACRTARADFLGREQSFPTPLQWVAFVIALVLAVVLFLLHGL